MNIGNTLLHVPMLHCDWPYEMASSPLPFPFLPTTTSYRTGAIFKFEMSQSALRHPVHPKRLAFSAEVTQFLKVEKPLKCLYSSKCLLSISHFQHIENSCSIFPLSRNIWCRHAFMSSLPLLVMPKTQMEQHTLVFDNTLLNNHTCYSFIPCTKWHSGLYCRLYSCFPTRALQNIVTSSVRNHGINKWIKILKFHKLSCEFLLGKWQYWSSLHVQPTASLFWFFSLYLFAIVKWVLGVSRG